MGEWGHKNANNLAPKIIHPGPMAGVNTTQESQYSYGATSKLVEPEVVAVVMQLRRP